MSAEAWVDYPCRVDDAHATILVDLQFEAEGRVPDGLDTLHVAGFAVPVPLPTGPAADLLGLTETLGDVGLHQVGRVETGGEWQLAWYGPGRRSEHFLAATRALSQRWTSPAWTHVERDEGWGYYRDFLLPDGERRLWLRNRDVVRRLQGDGDDSSLERPIDHELRFPSVEAAEVFLDTAALRGYESTARGASCGVRRSDRSELEAVHRVVMDLAELAAPYDGDHVMWSCEVVRD